LQFFDHSYKFASDGNLCYCLVMKSHEEYFELAAEQARKSLCERARCGAVIASAAVGEIVGGGV
jgi:deoxycytidylate deaminase